jgi:4-diphosphocytidyl-2-C-methyl-D-erythritol kinase
VTSERSAGVWIAAPAKLNLWLRVLERMESGFHSLETLFCAVSLEDRIHIQPGPPGVRLTVAGPVDLGPPERNLVHRAAALYLATSEKEGGVDIRLDKRIPAAAGLGGGSSDAAATLRALNVLFDSPLSDGDLLTLGSELGSDVPFFLCGSPVALAWGRGERLLALPPLPARRVLIAHPGEPMPTTEAFARLAALRSDGYRAPLAKVHAHQLASWEAVAALAWNDFEPVALAMVPVLEPALELLRNAGAVPTLLSGSGAAIFGVFTSERERTVAAARLRGLGLRTWSADTLEAVPEPQVDPPVRPG